MGGPLIDVGKLTKPATVLIEKISDAVCGIAKPWQMKRIAQAEAEAAIIHAETSLRISEIQRRALERMAREEGRNQENIESITAKAIPNVRDDANPEKIEPDWLTHFFERARIISDEEMQGLWANILAEEANNPGGFSKRSIELVAILSKRDASLFTKLCEYGFVVEDVYRCLLYREDWFDSGLSFDDLTHLDALGLIRFDAVANFYLTELPRNVFTSYFGTPINIEMSPSGSKSLMFKTSKAVDGETYTFDAGNVFLTQAGRELAKVCGAVPSSAV